MIKRLFTLTMFLSAMVTTALAADHETVNLHRSKAPAFVPENLPETYLTDVQGEQQTFAAQITINPDGFGDFELFGIEYPLIFSEDGGKVYFPQIIPLEGAQKEGSYVEGTLSKDSEDRRIITVKADQLIQNYETADEYLLAKTGMTTEEYAAYCNTTVDDVIESIGWTGPRYFYFVPAIDDPDVFGAMKPLEELVMVETKEGFFQLTIDGNVYLLSWLYDGNAGYDFMVTNLALTRVVEELISVPAEGVDYQVFQHTVVNSYDTQKDELCQVGFKDEKVYLPGLLFGETSAFRKNYVEGTIDSEGIITLTSPLFYNPESKDYKIIRAYDENAYISFDDMCVVANTEYSPIKLKYDTESGVISLLDNAQIGEFAYGAGLPDNLMKHTYINISKIPFNKPANPTKLKAQDFDEISFKIPFEDIYGNQISPFYLYYEIFVNTEDNPYIFTKENFWVKEDTSELPVSFSDFSVQNDKKGGVRVYWIGPEWEDLGVRSIYLLNGERKYSDIVWLSGRQNFVLTYDFVPESVSPEADSELESINSITFRFNEKVAINTSLLEQVSFKNNDGDVKGSFSVSLDGMSVVFTADESATSEGDYVMILPQGLFGTQAWADSQYRNGNTNDNLTYKWTVNKVSGINSVSADTTVKYFNLQGNQIKRPDKGQVVIRQTGSKVEKIVF